MMRSRIFAILFHLSSSDAHPKHMHCPQRAKSWCFHQRATAEGKKPDAHKDHETLPSEIGRKLVPIFNRLTNEDLLKRCQRGRAQNTNEFLHSLLWKLCPKAIFAAERHKNVQWH